MLISHAIATIDSKALYVTHKGHGANEEYWAVDEILQHRGVVWGVKMRKVDETSWQTIDKTHEFSKDHFLPGSGFGGKPYLESDYWLKIENNAIYRSLE